MPRKKKKPINGAVRNPTGGPRMRPTSRRPGFQRLRALKCFSEVHDRICDGWPLSEVARFIQEKRQEYDDVQHTTLMSLLQRYRATLPKSDIVREKMPQFHAEAMVAVEEDIDELAEFIKLFRMQESRLNIDHQTEKNINKLFGSMTQEMRVAGEILHRIAQLKMDLGMNERHLGKVDVETEVLGEVAARYEGTEIGKVLANPKSRRRLATVAEHALSLAKRGIALDAGALVSGGDPDDGSEEAC